MAKVRVVVKASGARQILNSQEIQDDLLERANRIKSKADSIGSGKYVADVRPGKNRAHAMVKTTDARSMASNRKHNTLLKSVDAGR